MPGGRSGVKLLPMTRPLCALLVALALGGCTYDKIDPPQLSHPREPRKSADPPPPIREDLYKNRTQLMTSNDAAPVRTSSSLIESRPAEQTPAREHPVPGPTVIEPGVVNPLR
jgi:hypothetical protein